MGFKVPKREAEITFEGTEYDGAQVNCNLDISLREWRGFVEISDPEEEAIEWIRLAKPTWNLEDENGEPIELTADSLMDQPIAFKNTVITAWMRQAVNPSVPLERRSPNGAVSAESVA